MHSVLGSTDPEIAPYNANLYQRFSPWRPGPIGPKKQSWAAFNVFYNSAQSHLDHIISSQNTGRSKLPTPGPSRRWQKSMLQGQLSVESKSSNCSESISVLFHNILPLLGPFLSVLTPPDAEIVFIYTKSFPVPVAIKISFNMAIKWMPDRH